MVLAILCMGAVSNVLISRPVGDYIFVSFRAGTPTACNLKIKITEGSKRLSVYEGKNVASSEYSPYQKIILKIKRVK